MYKFILDKIFLFIKNNFMFVISMCDLFLLLCVVFGLEEWFLLNNMVIY